MRPDMKIISWITLAALLLSACSALGESAAPTAQPDPAMTFDSVISATGIVRPARWAALSVRSQGIVAEVLVAEGDHVTAGQPLIRLEGQAAAQAKLAAAQLELLSAQQAVDALHDNAALQASRAFEALVNAHQVVLDAQRRLDTFDLQAYKDDLETARQDLADAQEALKTAREDFEPYTGWEESNKTRKTYQDRLDEAQRDYDNAARDLQQLEYAEQQAAAALALAQDTLASAQDAYDQRLDGPHPDELALAQSRLDAASAQLLAAREVIDNLELRAPFDGVVCELDARIGEWLGPAVPVLYLGDLLDLRVETTDLNEIDAARVNAGDDVIVTFDALPDTTVSGSILWLVSKSAEGSGVNYTAVIQLKHVPEGLRWGMTAFVDIEVDR